MSCSLHRRMSAAALLCAGLALAVGPSAAQQNERSPGVLLEEASKRVLIDGDLQGAIAIYRRILSLQGVPRSVVARSLLGLGQCHEALGDREARGAYERVVREYGDQAEEATLARARLAALGGGDAAMRVRQAWSGPHADLLSAVTRDGRHLLIQDWATQDLAVRDLASGEMRKLTNKDPTALEFALFSEPSPDGREVVYAWYNRDGFIDLRLVRIDGSAPRVLNADPGFDEKEPLDWSPDGKHVLAVFRRKGKGSQIVSVTALDGSVRVLKSFDQDAPKRARFSPDGRHVAYDFPQQPASPKHDLCVMTLDGGQVTVIARHPANDVLFDWTPDGARLLFASDRSGTLGAWCIALKDGAAAGVPQLLKPDLGADARPLGFARDGSYYYHSRTGLSDVFIAEVDFVSGRVLAPPALATERYAGTNSGPDWSPDGRQLLLVSRRGPAAGWPAKTICIRDLGTGEVREVNTTLQMLSMVRWGQDARSLLVAAQYPPGQFGPFRIDVESGRFSPADFLAKPMEVSPAWSSDRNTLFYAQWGPSKVNSIVARDLADGKEHVLHSVKEPAVYLGDVVLSPDGTSLAFAATDPTDGALVLRVMPVAGGDAREVWRTKLAFPVSVAWALDGTGLVSVSRPRSGDPASELWLVPVEGGEPRKVDLAATGMREVRVHPDGRHVAFTAGADRSEVWVLENFLPATK